MTYRVEIGGSIEYVNAGNAIEAAEKGIESYNEEYDICSDDWILGGGDPDSEEFADEIGWIAHVDRMSLDMVDADTHGQIWARYVGTDKDGKIAIAMATLAEDYSD